jgi:lipopolysaccharide export system protein LptA
MSGLARNRPVALAATHGELDRQKNQADFNHARYTSAGDVAEAELAHLYMRKDGSVERIEGVGQVRLEDAGQDTATCDHADVALDAANKPRTAVLTGNVHFVDDEPLRQARGESESADLGFDDQGRIDHAVLHGRVHTEERVQGSGGPASERRLASDELELNLAAEGGAKPVLREAKATGSAHLSSVAMAAGQGASGKQPGTTANNLTSNNLTADWLDAHFVAPHGAAELSTVHGEGHGVPRSSGERSVEVATAVQEGNVVIDRVLPAKAAFNSQVAAGAGPETQHATAGKASYDADSDRLTLTQAVQMSDAEITVSAARVVLEQNSGDATAEGGVKVTYLQAGSAEPVHVLAARAELNHDAGRATFYGRAVAGGQSVPGSGLARMWQAGAGQDASERGGSQIEAPVLVFEQETRRLMARPERPGQAGQVHTVLVSAASENRPTASQNKPAKSSPKTGSKAGGSNQGVGARQQGPVRITSSGMIYSDEQRQAEFTGGVRVVDSDGEMQARQATVFLTAPAAGAEKRSQTGAKGAQGAEASGLLGGDIERIVATQNIEIAQPGRRATGERLVYTASDQMFVLTGSASAPPKVVDAAQGSTTGNALRFHSGDDSVSVLGNDGEGPSRKVHTETRVKQ